LKLVAACVLIFLVALAMQQVPLLNAPAQYFKAHAEPWRTAALGTAGVGFALLGVAWASIILRGRPMTDDEARAHMRTGAGQPHIRRVVSGPVRGWRGKETSSLRAVKAAYRDGTWLTDPARRPFGIGVIGLLTACVGLFGVFVVIGPPVVQLICITTLAYVLGRTAWAFWRA